MNPTNRCYCGFWSLKEVLAAQVQAARVSRVKAVYGKRGARWK